MPYEGSTSAKQENQKLVVHVYNCKHRYFRAAKFFALLNFLAFNPQGHFHADYFSRIWQLILFDL